jgi:hypothetical protein
LLLPYLDDPPCHRAEPDSFERRVARTSAIARRACYHFTRSNAYARSLVSARLPRRLGGRFLGERVHELSKILPAAGYIEVGRFQFVGLCPSELDGLAKGSDGLIGECRGFDGADSRTRVLAQRGKRASASARSNRGTPDTQGFATSPWESRNPHFIDWLEVG